MARVSILSVPVGQLESFLEDFYSNQREEDVVPLSSWRARAQMQNPHADPNDVGLLVAHLGRTCVGYLGVVPCVLRTGDRFSKVYFSSTAYVPEQYRNTGAGLYLGRAYRNVDMDLVGADNRPRAERLLRSFRSLKELPPYRIFRLPKSFFLNSQMASIAPPERFRYELLTAEGVKNIPVWHRSFNGAEFYRDLKTLAWTLTYPWTQLLEKTETREQKYFFGEWNAEVRYFPIAFYEKDNGRYFGFQLFSTRWKNGKRLLKVLDSNFENRGDRKHIWPLIAQYVAQEKIDSVEVGENLMATLDSVSFLRSLPFVFNRTYFIKIQNEGSPLALAYEAIERHYADGDCAFT